MAHVSTISEKDADHLVANLGLRVRLACDYQGCTRRYAPRVPAKTVQELREKAWKRGWSTWIGEHKSDCCPEHNLIIGKRRKLRPTKTVRV